MINLNLSLAIQRPDWRTIYTIPQGTVIPKGRKNPSYKSISSVTGEIQERYGCYAWGDNSDIYYCGSFTDDYTGERFKSNFQGRIHNYLQNHRIENTGRKNTNLRVFENINSALPNNSVSLYLFTFFELHIGDTILDFASFTNDSALVQAVEQLLICIYRRNGQCQWNRT